MAKSKTWKKIRQNYYLTSFLWGFVMAFSIFIVWMIYGNGYFFFYGDFNVQQIPFYQMIHDSVQSGNIGWSYTTDLGANIIGSYSFYMMGSPFFYLTLLLPSAAVPYMMAPLLMLKFGCISLAGYTFLRRYVKNQDYALIGAILYAFSGFGIYNIFFNHFHEAMITFPFLLAAVDSFIYERKRGYLAVAVFAASFVNYYFFAGQAVFIFLYWCFRMATGSYKMSLKEFFRFAFEIISGFLCAMVILLPSILAVLQNSRVNNFPKGWSSLAYSSEQRYILIISSFFFPPDMPAYANFAPDSNAKWASVAAWLPLFSMVGVFSFYKLKTQRWLKIFIPVLFVMALIPVLNCIFQLLNATYYARWYYMLTMMLVLATTICLDNQETDYRTGIKITFAVTASMAALIGLMPNDDGLGLEKYPDRFWAWVAIAILGLVALVIVMTLKNKRKLFTRAVAIALSAMIAVYGNVLIGVGVVNSNYKPDFIENYAIGNKDKFPKIKDLKNVRSDFYKAMDNMGMFWQVPTIQAFQSIVPGSIMDFYKSVGVERSVGSRPDTDVYGIRSFLSCKYLFDYIGDGNNFMENQKTKMPGWKFLDKDNGYEIYENENYIPYGFTYDEYITESQYRSIDEDKRHLLLLKAMVLSDEQAKKYKDIIQAHTSVFDFDFSEDAYFEDCKERNKLTCSSMDFQKNEFTAQITTNESSELVFFSIPYEDGWSAEVNGEAVEIEKVNIGFMAVKVPANQTSTIKFSYRTPGLVAGAAVSGLGILMFGVYMFLWKPQKRRTDGLALYEDYEGSEGWYLDMNQIDEKKLEFFDDEKENDSDKDSDKELFELEDDSKNRRTKLK